MNDTYRRAAMQRDRNTPATPMVEQTFNINCRGEGDSCNVLSGDVGKTKKPGVKETVNQGGRREGHQHEGMPISMSGSVTE